jgi:prolyl-tRNA synthetase
MRWSKTFIPTLRDDPAEAETASHRLMIRAGLIRKLASGTYTYLPLGWRSLRKAIQIVREEMDRAGALEILMPVLQPVELWEASGRAAAFGDLMCRVKDRAGRMNVLGPTHEEVITDLVHQNVTSYRQLPATFYQIGVKFRDEIRPRFGIIRSREFIMKDAYSFDADPEGLSASYQAMYDAYVRIFTRAGLRPVIVEADTGLIGGDVSHEFMVPTPTGEDVITACAKCGYAANREKIECPAPAYAPEAARPAREVATPGASTIEQVSGFLKVPPAKVIKTLIVVADGKPVAVLIRGDHEANPAKLARVLHASSVELATEETIRKVTGGPLGFSGPVDLKERIRVVADLAVAGPAGSLPNAVTGANKADTHRVDVNAGRDYAPTESADLRLAVAGDPCPRCRAPLAFTNGVEIGHVFKLGTKYSEKLGATFQAADGRLLHAIMGCYGIGVNRIVASAIESSHDADGIRWPLAVAPYEVLLVSVNMKDERIRVESERLYAELVAAGHEVLWDDRDLAPGVKFKDADLVGIPIRLTLGGKGLEKGTVDLKLRTRKEQRPVPRAEVVAAVAAARMDYAETFHAPAGEPCAEAQGRKGQS